MKGWFLASLQGRGNSHRSAPFLSLLRGGVTAAVATACLGRQWLWRRTGLSDASPLAPLGDSAGLLPWLRERWREVRVPKWGCGMSPELAEAGGMQVWMDWAQPGPGYRASQASRMVGREVRAGEDHGETRGSSSPSLRSCSPPTGVPFRHLLPAREQATVNEFSKNEW